MLAAVAGDVAADEICLHKSNTLGARVRPGHQGLFLAIPNLQAATVYRLPRRYGACHGASPRIRFLRASRP